MLAEQPHTGAPTFNMPYGGAEGAYPVTTEHYSRAPLFQRIESTSSMTGDHYNELQESQRELEKYRQRTYELERMYAESEKISAAQGKQRMELEAELNEKQRNHTREMESKRQEIAEWEKRYNALAHSHNKMEDKVNRLERELHGILAKKYAIVQEAKREARKQVLEEEAIKRDVSRLIARRSSSSCGGGSSAGPHGPQQTHHQSQTHHQQHQQQVQDRRNRSGGAAAEDNQSESQQQQHQRGPMRNGQSQSLLPPVPSRLTTFDAKTIRIANAVDTLNDFFGF